ncbi:MAG: LysR family transcriptional regulator [Lachnospiraceae bacterium]|jgi:DNA-binding transcriptional LysR family regulator|nr:LysR family transcriptional regulator [Lachnospiraceae bacterium]
MNNLEIASFMSLYKTRDAAAAADVLSITPRALEQNLKRLEAELGFALFLRHDKDLDPAPTLAGRRFYDYFWARGKDLSHTLRTMRGEDVSGILCICWCDWSGCPDWVIRTIRRFKSDFPGVRLQVRQASSKMLKEQLYGGEVDIALTSHITAGSLNGQFFSTDICDTPLYFIISATHPAAPDLAKLAERGSAARKRPSPMQHPHRGGSPPTPGVQRPAYTPLDNIPFFTSYLDDDDNESKVIARTGRFYRDQGLSPPEVTVLPNWESVYVEVNMHSGVTLAPMNLTVKTHDCFALLPTGVDIPLISLQPVRTVNRYTREFSERLAREAAQRDE